MGKLSRLLITLRNKARLNKNAYDYKPSFPIIKADKSSQYWDLERLKAEREKVDKEISETLNGILNALRVRAKVASSKPIGPIGRVFNQGYLNRATASLNWHLEHFFNLIKKRIGLSLGIERLEYTWITRLKRKIYLIMSLLILGLMIVGTFILAVSLSLYVVPFLLILLLAGSKFRKAE